MTINFSKGEPNSSLLKKKLLFDSLTPSHYNLDQLFYYTVDDRGAYDLRVTIDKMLAYPHTSHEHIIVTNGALAAFDMLLRFFIDTIDEFYVFEPTYRQALTLLKTFNKPIFVIPRYIEGNVEWKKLFSFLKKKKKSLFYIISNINNPDGVSLNENDREKFAELSYMSNNKIRIIEDDVYKDLFFDKKRRKTIFEFACEKEISHQVFQLGSFSKSLMPGLRLGYLLASPQNIQSIIGYKVDFSHSSLLEHLSNQILSHKEKIARQINHLTNCLNRRKNMALSCFLSENRIEDVSDPEGGYFLWVRLPDKINSSDLLVRCRKRGVEFLPGNEFFIHQKSNFLRFSYGYCQEEDIVKGVKVIVDEIRGYMRE